jgi:2-oxoisovalerate dehydrogenase E1 component
LREQHGLNLRVIDLRWLAPLNEDGLIEAVSGCSKVLIVDECRRTGSQSEALMALFAERAPDVECRRLTAEDSFIPLGRAATLTLPSRDSIVAAALELVRG